MERPDSLGGRDATTADGHDETGRTAAAGESDRYYLLVFEGESSRMVQLPRSGDVVIGRGDGADLKLSDNAVSRAHARLSLRQGQARLADLESRHGTKLNDEPLVGSRLLATGDVISIGEVSLVFHASRRIATRAGFLELAQLQSWADEELERSVRYYRPLAVTSFCLGGGEADRPRVANAVAPRLRRLDAGAWAGQDQLVVLSPELDLAAAQEHALQLLEGLEPLSATARAGLAVCPGDGVDFDTLLARARAAMLAVAPGELGLASQTYQTLTFGDRAVIVADPVMARLYRLLERLARSDLPVLIWGETGTGKELAASALHHYGPRRQRPLVTVNCAALQDTLLESELFGHEKGAFTGAVGAKVGLLESASGGTVFLDELCELSASAQAKLLRVLETKKVARLGDVREREVDIRVVAATNRNVEEAVKAGRFRQDLYFRLSGATLWLPPLRDRRAELPILARTFLAQAGARLGRPAMTLSDAAMQRLSEHEWPGNVRELKNVMEYLAAAALEDVVDAYHLAERLGATPSAAAVSNAVPAMRPEREAPVDRAAETPDLSPSPASEKQMRPIAEEVRELERARMAEALALAGGNQTKAAEAIKMPLRTFVTKLRQYNLRK